MLIFVPKSIFMKKTLLLASLLFGIYTTVSAQQTISFETTEDYTLGVINNQNGWLVTDNNNAEGPGVANVVVSDGLENYEGNALKFVSTNGDGFAIVASKNITPGADIFSITQKIYAAGRDADNGSDITLLTTDTQGDETFLTSGIKFDYEGKIQVLSSYHSSIFDEYYYTPRSTFEANTWYDVKMTFNITAGTVEYFINDHSIFSSAFVRGTAVDAIAYEYDALTISYFIDDIIVSTPTTGIDTPQAVKFTVSPNPATDVVSIANSQDALVNSITITDINGRTIKTNNFEETAIAQVNISDLSAGIYILTISSDKGTTTKKIVKN